MLDAVRPLFDGAEPPPATPAPAPGGRESEVRAALRGWIRQHKSAARVTELTDQTLLLESGLLTSLDIVELVMFIEELREEEVDPDHIEPETFTSIDTIWAGFFADDH